MLRLPLSSALTRTDSLDIWVGCVPAIFDVSAKWRPFLPIDRGSGVLNSPFLPFKKKIGRWLLSAVVLACCKF